MQTENPANLSDDAIEDRLREFTRQRQAVIALARPYREELDRRIALESLAQRVAQSSAEERVALTAMLDAGTRQDVYERAEKWASFQTPPDPPKVAPAPAERRFRLWG